MGDTNSQWDNVEENQFRGVDTVQPAQVSTSYDMYSTESRNDNAYGSYGSSYGNSYGSGYNDSYQDGYGMGASQNAAYEGLNPIAAEDRATEVLHKSYAFMVMALILSAISALYTLQSQFVILMILNRSMFYGMLVAEVVVVCMANAALTKQNVGLSTFLFFAYSIINGITLSVCCIAYARTSILSVFVLAAITFAILSVIGLTTKANLNSLGVIGIMILVGVIGLSIMNIVFQSGIIEMFVAVVGLVAFVLLTLYDTRKIKEIGFEDTESDTTLLGIMGALQLYLDLINIFLYLLRLFGGSRD